jgi:hypothetical protein
MRHVEETGCSTQAKGYPGYKRAYSDGFVVGCLSGCPEGHSSSLAAYMVRNFANRFGVYVCYFTQFSISGGGKCMFSILVKFWSTRLYPSWNLAGFAGHNKEDGTHTLKNWWPVYKLEPLIIACSHLRDSSNSTNNAVRTRGAHMASTRLTMLITV